MHRINFRSKLYIIALLPSLLVSLALAWYLNHSSWQENTRFNEQRSNQVLQQLSVLSQFGLLRQDLLQLQAIADAALEDPGILSVTLYNAKQEKQVYAGPQISKQRIALPLTETLEKHREQQSIRMSAPVFKNHLINHALRDSSSNPLADNILGWVEIEYSNTSAEISHYQNLLISLVIIVLGTALAVTLAYYVNARLRAAVSQLKHSLNQLQSGEISSDALASQEAEFQPINQTLQDLSAGLQHELADMQTNVEQTTSDLRETLETIEIQNIELDLARKEAVEASRIKSEFLANTSHEIRTPLNGIIGFTNLLLKSPLSHQQQDYLQTIRQSSEGLLTIINDILDFSKIEAGKLVLDTVALNLRNLLDEALNMLAPVAQEKGLELVLLIYPEVPGNYTGDPLRIKQVVTNLVNNAIKFTKQGNIIVRVSLEQSDYQDSRLIIAISDPGIGLSPQQQRDIFDAFTQANSSISRQFGGTGLGLVICKRLVEQMGGDIGLESELGKGSTFWFSLKLEPTEALPQNRFELLTQRKFCLYDPNPAVSLSWQCLLESWHCQSTTIGHSNWDYDLTAYINEDIDGFLIGVEAATKTEQLAQLNQQIRKHPDKAFVLLVPNSQWQQEHPLPDSPNLLALVKPAPQIKLYRSLCQLLMPEHLDQLPDSQLSQRNPGRLLRPLNILTADDNKANLKLIGVLLNEMGASVTRASNGIEALREMEKQRFDLVLMDIQMPEMDGITATKRIRQMPDEIAQTPVIALTAHALAEERDKLIKDGLNDHLTKPVNEPQLWQIIQRWCPGSLSTSPGHEITHNTNHRSDKPIDAQAAGDTQALAAYDTSATNPKPVDIQTCLSLAGGKAQLAYEMLDMLCQRLEQDVTDISHSFEQQDYQSLLEQVHKFHGATCYTGVSTLREATANYETAIKQQQHSELLALHQAFIQAAQQLQSWYEAHELAIVFELDELA